MRFIDQSLNQVFAHFRVDAKNIAVAGFSDGASYALGLGISNGDLFRAIIAFSPGFIPDGWAQKGKPRVFISHGTNDQILPFDMTSRKLVPDLKRGGYDVKFQQFDGLHTVPPEIARSAMQWLLK